MNSIACKLTSATIFAVFTYAVFAEPDDASQAEEVGQANAQLAIETSSLSKAFDDAGTMPFRCRTALKDFEKAIADANSAAVAQRAKVAEITRTYLKNALDKAQAAGDLGKVIAFRKALETADGEIAGDAEEIVKLRNGRAAQLEKIDKNLVASGITAANGFRTALEWQKKELVQKGDVETAQKIDAYQKRIDGWAKTIKDGASGEPRPVVAVSEVSRPDAQLRPQPRPAVSEIKRIEPEAKIVTIDAKNKNGTLIGEVKAGDTVEIQYVSGKWIGNSSYPVRNPDKDRGHAGNGLVLCRRSDSKYILATIPEGTQGNPFIFSVDDEDAGELALRIADEHTGDNVGSVRYSVKIIPGEASRAANGDTGGRRPPPQPVKEIKRIEPEAESAKNQQIGGFSNQTLTGTQTEVSVTLSKTLTPHIVKGLYLVPQGKELIVEAGATIVFEKDGSLCCEGTLKMQGTEQSPIICKGKMSKKDYWKGVEIKGGSSAVEFAIISDAQIGILVKGTRSIVKSCCLRHNENGIVLRWDGKPSIVENCLLKNNTVGIRWENSHGSTVRNCSFLNNDDCGMILWNPWPAEGIAALNCVFSENRFDGIRGTTHCAKEASIKNCSFSKNGRYDIDIGPFPKLNCRQNYWGERVTRILQQRGVDTNLPNIKDGRDSGRDNTVDVAEFLTEPPKDCGATVKF